MVTFFCLSVDSGLTCPSREKDRNHSMSKYGLAPSSLGFSFLHSPPLSQHVTKASLLGTKQVPMVKDHSSVFIRSRLPISLLLLHSQPFHTLWGALVLPGLLGNLSSQLPLPSSWPVCPVPLMTPCVHS
jgi:hypothetical protein